MRRRSLFRNKGNGMESGIPIEGLQAYFRMEEESGNPIDELGNAATLIERYSGIAGTDVRGVSGKNGLATNFDGGTMKITCNNVRSISLWINKNAIQRSGTSWQYLFGARPTYPGYVTTLANAGITYVTHNGTKMPTEFYVNDLTVGEFAHVYIAIDEAFSGNFRLMGRGSDGLDPLCGILDEVAIYNRILTDAEVATIYNNGNGRTF